MVPFLYWHSLPARLKVDVFAMNSSSSMLSMQTTQTAYHVQETSSVHSRMKTRVMDISESYHLLMELGTQDPVMQHCLKTLQGMCLSQGIHIGKKKDSSAIYSKSHMVEKEGLDATHSKAVGDQIDVKATREFQKHIDKYFLPFCSEAIRYFFVCGFVPWHVRRLPSTGDLIPEILPLGTFTWHVELRSEREKRKRNDCMNNAQNEAFHTSYVPAIISRREGNASGFRAGKILKREDKWHTRWHEAHRMNEQAESYKDLKLSDCSENGFRKELGHPAGSKSVKKDRETQYVQYRVVMTAGDLTEDEIYIYDFLTPNYGVCNNSMMYATIPSPIAHLLVDYKNLRQAQIRRAHAGVLLSFAMSCFLFHLIVFHCLIPAIPFWMTDAWNTQAHLVTTYKPANTNSNIPEWKGFNYGSGEHDLQCPRADGNPLMMLFDTNGESEVATRDHLIRRQVMQGKPHDPVVYTLPKHSELEAQVDLKPVEDIGFLLEKFSRDVAFLLGIPPNFVVSRTSLTSSNAAAIQAENTSTFTTNAQAVCKHLQALLSDVHQVIYGKPMHFTVLPVPRLSIESVEDLKNLMDTGLVLPEKAASIVDILLGTQNLPTSGAEGGDHARRVQKLMLDPPQKPAASSSSSSKK